MQHGKIVEVGTHAELMQKKAHYHQLVMAQLFEDRGSGYISGEEDNGLGLSHDHHAGMENAYHVSLSLQCTI